MLTRSAARVFSTAGLNLKVVNNVAKQQFLVTVLGKEALLKYETEGKNITFVETQVPEEFKGRGIGKALAKHAFDHALKNKLNVTCKCHFLAHFYENHKADYKPLKIQFDLEIEKNEKRK